MTKRTYPFTHHNTRYQQRRLRDSPIEDTTQRVPVTAHSNQVIQPCHFTSIDNTMQNTFNNNTSEMVQSNQIASRSSGFGSGTTNFRPHAKLNSTHHDYGLNHPTTYHESSINASGYPNVSNVSSVYVPSSHIDQGDNNHRQATFSSIPRALDGGHSNNKLMTPYFSRAGNISRTRMDGLFTGVRRPRDQDLSPKDYQKRMERRRRNKEAAARCRKKREDLRIRLEEQTRNLEDQRSRLEREYSKLMAKSSELRAIIDSHLPRCQKLSFIKSTTASEDKNQVATSSPSVLMTERINNIPCSETSDDAIVGSVVVGDTCCSNLAKIKEEPIDHHNNVDRVIVGKNLCAGKNGDPCLGHFDDIIEGNDNNDGEYDCSDDEEDTISTVSKDERRENKDDDIVENNQISEDINELKSRPAYLPVITSTTSHSSDFLVTPGSSFLPSFGNDLGMTLASTLSSAGITPLMTDATSVANGLISTPFSNVGGVLNTPMITESNPL